MECVFTLIAFVAGFLVAQMWKLVSGLVSGRATQRVVNLETAIGYFTRSGGMPSGHTASLTAAVIYLGCAEGFGTGLFALALCVWMIVVYDAIHVRYAVGVQGEALNGLLVEAGKKELPLVEGHTVAQVAMGAMIGLMIGFGMAFITGIL